MSFEYIRKQSAAARAAQRRSENARLLKLKTIEEISVVDRGAGVGCEIVFAKQYREVDVMTSRNAACNQAIMFAKRGDISAATFDKIFKAAARDAFPLERSEGAAMAKFIETALGLEMLRTGVALPTAHQAALMKTP